ncbi:SKU5 similar 5 [Striga hermonthica]|uniref:SKU5 similar 5 n=1 Tax=Striga hermonthica TaxID=68872 RepID=A0A9N7N6B4_STRHE|nr:SKU5 similar 5 [Striga hermonthica]
MWKFALITIFFCGLTVVCGENPYKFYTWNVTYGDIYPLGVRQRGILINGQFPGPEIEAVTNDNIIINVFNNLDEPFLLSWQGIQHRKNSFQDGVYGTNCPIPPGKNYTYALQMKDQIGSFFYFPSLGFQKAAGGFGGIRILSRPQIPVPFPPPEDDFMVVIGDWYKSDHKRLRSVLEQGKMILPPDGVLINGRSKDSNFIVKPGRKTYRFRIVNVGAKNSLNFQIQNHTMKLVEVEGTHTVQNEYDSLDVHVGQSYSVLVTADQSADKSYRIVVSSRFSFENLNATAILQYGTQPKPLFSSPLPPVPTGVDWSLAQARSIRTNLTASGPRPNPQGSYHYGKINLTRTIRLLSSGAQVNGKQRYALNGVSFVPGDTPLKLADYYNISGVFTVGSIPDRPPKGKRDVQLKTSVMGADYRAFIEIILENNDKIMHTYHLDGYAFFVVGMDKGKWKPESRGQYNLNDAISRSTVQVYAKSWTAIYVALDNVGMWNFRSEYLARQYLGQQFYLRVYSEIKSYRDEYDIPRNALLCGRAAGRSS